MGDANGTAIWFKLTTPDQDRAQAFYQQVMGWTIAPSPQAEHGAYCIASAADGSGIAGFMTPPPGMEGMPGWTIYLAADDVDAMAERIKALGGQVHFGPMDIPQVGRFATVADPQGVAFQIMRGDSAGASAAFKPAAGNNSIGHGVWLELATPDADNAFAFYGQLFGWTKAGTMPMGPLGDYSFIGAGGLPCPAGEEAATGPGAIMSSTATGAPARWTWYVHVPDIDAAIATAIAAGGALLQGPDHIPGGIYSANLADPDGQLIGIVGPRTR